jgi:hypothetical protein
MKLIRIVFFGLAVLLPTSWTIAMAGDEAPAEETKKTKKTKKAKKDDKKKDDESTEKKAE